MKRKILIKHFNKFNCRLLREGGNHSWWQNSENNLKSAVPRHSEINNILANKICKDLGIPKIT